MRIVAGIAGGIRLASPPGSAVRPTSDMVREAIFASLGDIRGQVVADLFAGTGALGLEALSRGAAEVFLVEQDPRNIRIIHRNLEAVAAACEAGSSNPGTAKVLRGDAYRPERSLPALAGRLDLILADPPYAAEPPGPGPADLLASQSFAAWGAGALLMFQHHAKAPMPWHPAGPWRLVKQKLYGITMVSFARLAGG